MTTFYISPSCLAYKQYKNLLEAGLSFGWTPSWEWPHTTFHTDAFIHKNLISKALNAISRSDIFIAIVPGTASTNIEIGTAYTLCQELFLVAKDPVHFTQTGLADAHLSVLPGVKRICCDIEEIPLMLRQEYLHLIDAG
jgi:hypothetical protein